MDTSWSNIVNSDLFTFKVGPNKKAFTIHSGAVLRLSKYFVSLINGGMREAKEPRVMWDDIDENTFILFSQYAYTGMYTVASMHLGRPEQEENEDDVSVQLARDQFARSSFPTRTLKDWAQELKDLTPRTSKQEGILAILRCICPQDWVFSALLYCKQHISAATLITHAKLYVLADRYGILSLKATALFKLSYDLITSLFDFRAVEHVSELIRYTWSNTLSQQGTGSGDELRQMLILFGALVFDVFRLNPSFKAVLCEHGEFADGILEKVGHFLI